MADENENQQEETQEEASTTFGGLKQIGFAILILGLAYYFYTAMTSYENGEEITMNSILLIAYKALGKNITAGILGLIGGVTGFLGVKEIIAAQKS